MTDGNSSADTDEESNTSPDAVGDGRDAATDAPEDEEPTDSASTDQPVDQDEPDDTDGVLDEQPSDGRIANTASQSGGSPVETKGSSSTRDTPEVDETADALAETDAPAAGTDVDGFSGDVDLEDLDLDTESESETDEASRGLFDDLLEGEPIFENKEVLRPSYTPHKLPHREEQINNMATILVTALRGDTPSNILIYGKTGTGKTASAKFVSEELESTSQKYEVPCEVEYINCEVTDTQYRVLAQLANKFIDKNEEYIEERLDELGELRDEAAEDPEVLVDSEFDNVAEVEAEIGTLEDDLEEFEPVPMTGWPTDRVYQTFFDAVDYHERVVVIMLDEIDKLVEKSGDDTLYNLSRMNSELDNSRVSIMGISNDLKFTDFLDPRVKSSLGEEEIVFPPYDATQLRDILQHRSEIAFKSDTLSEDVIPLCAAFAAQEHGDARRALDLLRTAGELAERDRTETVDEKHVRHAQEKIELDRVVEVVRTLPTQSKLVLYAIILLEKNGVHNINTGEVFNIYKRLAQEIDADVLTQRRVTDLISELDMLGIVNAVVVSKGRYGRTKEISLSVPLDETEAVLLSDSRVGEVEDAQPFVQARFD
ncbi:AAA family ATPase [Natronomonas halophila]|uniref:AAA family ATPase n=1 Tax=Natronomonas halophila TaxID=2747817 RepID=UPI001FE2A968|nr:AAA family ATPase [Natronomonas halophila]